VVVLVVRAQSVVGVLYSRCCVLVVLVVRAQSVVGVLDSRCCLLVCLTYSTSVTVSLALNCVLCACLLDHLTTSFSSSSSASSSSSPPVSCHSLDIKTEPFMLDVDSQQVL
jgi:hypothetical protein